MATFYLIRHGEPDYNVIADAGFYGFGVNFAPLTESGIMQAEQTAKDKRLLDAELIVCSPYTRALQTASIISRFVNKKIVIEPLLHEWINDKTNTLSSDEEARGLFEEFLSCRGVYPEGTEPRWENVNSLIERVKSVADKYSNYNKIIFVCHGMVCRVLARTKGLSFAEIIECEYKKGQALPQFFD